MDPNHWPALVWLFIALVFGAFVACLGLLIWNAAFRRQKTRWILDIVLLGFPGLILVAVLMIFIASSSGRLSKGPQRLIGEFVMAAAGEPLVWGGPPFFPCTKG